MTRIVLGSMPNGNLVGYVADCNLPISWTPDGNNAHGYGSDYDLTPEERLISPDSLTKKLHDALNDIMKCVEAGVLVRNTSRDAETGWALHQLPLLLSLRAAQEALSAVHSHCAAISARHELVMVDQGLKVAGYGRVEIGDYESRLLDLERLYRKGVSGPGKEASE